MSRPWVEDVQKPKDIIAEMIKPRTLDQMIAEYEHEREET